MDEFSRTKALLGEEKFNRLKSSCVAIFGLGGVGGYVFEGIIRSGVEKIIIIDYDIIDITNINRQLIANNTSIGKKKVDEFFIRGKKINSSCDIIKKCVKIEKIDDLSFLDHFKIDYIADAIDGFEGKISLIKYSRRNNINIISSMGAGNKLKPQEVEISDIYSTKMCPLARKIRKRLRKENIESLNVVYSKEQPIKQSGNFVGSVSYVPSVVGFIMVSKIVEDLCFENNENKF